VRDLLEGAAVCDKHLPGCTRARAKFRPGEPEFRHSTAAYARLVKKAGVAGERSLGNEQRTTNRRESLEKTIAKILHRYCNFGWANYYIPGEKFPSLIEELVEIASPAGQAGYEEIVHFFLRTQRMTSAQERAAKLMEEFGVYRKA